MITSYYLAEKEINLQQLKHWVEKTFKRTIKYMKTDGGVKWTTIIRNHLSQPLDASAYFFLICHKSYVILWQTCLCQAKAFDDLY